MLADYLRSLSDDDLAAATRFFAGSTLTLSLGGSSILAAARRVWEFDDAAVSDAYRATGDLGKALAALSHPPRVRSFFTETLTPATLARAFEEIANIAGKGANKRREAILERVFHAYTDPPAVAYVVKIISGDLRAGLREGLVLDAIARAFDAPPPYVRRALMASGDAGAVAVAARNGKLADLRVAYGTPIGFMLASPIAFAENYRELATGNWIAEDKYDGIRAQAHVRSGTAQLFSRRLNDISGAYPDVVSALPPATSGDAIFDGEILAMRDGRVLPFRMLQARLQRKTIDDALLQEIPVAYVAFDLLAAGSELLLDEPLHVRRARLAEVLVPGDRVVIAPYDAPADAGDDVNARFEAARSRGNEGLVFKRTDSPYAPGRRGKWWLKLKRELATIDAVVIAVEWGHGKRARVLSDYTFAVRDRDRLAAIGKAYSGLSDTEIAELTPWFLEHRLPATAQRPKARAFEIPVDPKVVIEVAFDVIAPSDLHESGFALRFPRIVRIRDDKPPDEIDTLDRVREIYTEMLQRENLSS